MAGDKHGSGQSGADNTSEKEGTPKEQDSGLGNLPPLSDFDSGGFQSDSTLPVLGTFDSDGDKKSAGGLPPISDIPIETPRPTGGNIKPSPPGFEMAEAEFESPTFETPRPPKPAKGRGFQDAAADSDFSPETPEIGPGPDSDLDTPMFDSAFGAGGAATRGTGGFTPAFDTPAPTQAMETPMFGAQGKAETPMFDEGAFAPDFAPGAAPAFDAGTPAPDFSPDTAPGRGGIQTPEPKAVKAAKAPSGPKGLLVTVLAAVICLVIGIGAGPFISSKVTVIPNPYRTESEAKQTEIEGLNKTISRLQQVATPGVDGAAVSRPELDKMISEKEELNKTIADLKNQGNDAKAKLDKTSSDLDQVRADLDSKNEEFVKLQDAYEDLQNQTAIVQARQMGLMAEVDRLTGLVGTMEDASDRSRATAEALQASVNRLVIQIREGIPLTPEKYSRTSRLAAAEDLKKKVDEAKWVTPALLDAYTTLYQKELDINAATTYFFARIPVTNKLNETETKWAECVMKGNWAVYYRTLDGKNIGSYENVAEPGMTPQYVFRETLPDRVQKQIEDEVVAARTPGYEEKLRVLAEKQSIMEGTTTPFQHTFNSL